MSRLQDVDGCLVEDVRSLHGYWQLQFRDAILTIINPIKVTRNGAPADLMSATGQCVSAVLEGVDDIQIELQDGLTLLIDMRPESYICPEAMHLCSGSLIVVW